LSRRSQHGQLAWIVAALAPFASAQPGPPEGQPDFLPDAVETDAPPVDIGPLIADLDAPEVARRLHATDTLTGSPGVTLPHLEAALLEPGLSLEQRRRLLAAAKRRFFSEPRAAMGVSNRDAGLGGGRAPIIVQPTQAGFHAMEVLRADDRLESIDGVRLESWDHCRCVIISHDPGDVVELGIVRGGTPMQVKVRLGRYDDLRQTLSADVVGAAWALRSAPYSSLESGRPVAIESGIDPAAWFDRPRSENSRRLRTAPDDDGGARLTAGGESRGGAGDDLFGGVFLHQPGRQFQIGNRRAFDERVEREQVQSQIRGLRQQHELIKAVADANRAALADDRLPAAERARLLEELGQHEAVLAELRNLIDQLEAAQRPR
jgi:hypothetical protein